MYVIAVSLALEEASSFRERIVNFILTEKRYVIFFNLSYRYFICFRIVVSLYIEKI